LFAGRGLAKFKTPEAVLAVESIPMLPTGKPDRLRLKDFAATTIGARTEQS
jgi:non-ribosomal peptide synthetase component E (peptide arylation enzyme)